MPNGTDNGLHKGHDKNGNAYGYGKNKTEFPCFAVGTAVLTPTGQIPIENLTIGDLVQTMDHGAKPVRWIGKSIVDATGRLAPVIIPKGAIDNERDLIVSPQHRILVSTTSATLYLGEPQVLVPAISMVGWMGIHQKPMAEITYVHVMFDQHEVIFTEGAATESLLIGPQSRLDLPTEALDEIFEIFPDLIEKAHIPARPCVPNRLARALL
ncbi:hypothetical protein BVC71_05750 [Marivivens niveibacter]|uniref:Hedgehog/Intein (Hint) domain-containing protein n=1 Tax=Marivivens niveibacter TaxID=1930667 RepID=A0A251X3I4_9RHOB|nr:Hint domain-containing protein [Marivivens niveibacter]OUD10965.1 hypothetical protein BVC71_05750 [Marivivens niveibacter]